MQRLGVVTLKHALLTARIKAQAHIPREFQPYLPVCGFIHGCRGVFVLFLRFVVEY